MLPKIDPFLARSSLQFGVQSFYTFPQTWYLQISSTWDLLGNTWRKAPYRALSSSSCRFVYLTFWPWVKIMSNNSALQGANEALIVRLATGGFSIVPLKSCSLWLWLWAETDVYVGMFFCPSTYFMSFASYCAPVHTPQGGRQKGYCRNTSSCHFTRRLPLSMLSQN